MGKLCPLDGFELLLFSPAGGGKQAKAPFMFCPFCFNEPPFEIHRKESADWNGWKTMENELEPNEMELNGRMIYHRVCSSLSLFFPFLHYVGDSLLPGFLLAVSRVSNSILCFCVVGLCAFRNDLCALSSSNLPLLGRKHCHPRLVCLTERNKAGEADRMMLESDSIAAWNRITTSWILYYRNMKSNNYLLFVLIWTWFQSCCSLSRFLLYSVLFVLMISALHFFPLSWLLPSLSVCKTSALFCLLPFFPQTQPPIFSSHSALSLTRSHVHSISWPKHEDDVHLARSMVHPLFSSSHTQVDCPALEMTRRTASRILARTIWKEDLLCFHYNFRA